MTNEVMALSHMYEDIGLFHEKFKLLPYDGFENTPKDFIKFRENFLIEEASETFHAMAAKNAPGALDGLVDLAYIALGTIHQIYGQDELDFLGSHNRMGLLNIYMVSCNVELTKNSGQFLYELARGCRSTAVNLNWDFDTAWTRVHAANMTKIRTARPADSKRGSGFDVVKPEGWVAPVLIDLVH